MSPDADRPPAALAGALAAGLALAIGELLAAFLPGVVAPVTAVSQQVIPLTPPGVEAWAIRTFGTADKVVLEIGTTVLALAVGAAAGAAARRRFAVATGVFAGFGLLGLVATSAQPDTAFPLVLLVVVAAVAVGLTTLHILLSRLQPDVGRPPEGAATPTDPPVARRAFLRLAGGVGSAAVVTAATGRLAVGRLTGDDPGALALPTPAPARALGEPPAGSAFDVDGLSPLLTPNEEFFRIDTALMVPRVDLDTFELRVHGLVEQELVLGYDDLLEQPLVETDSALACVSNEVGGPLVGNARWLGVRLDGLLRRAGIDPRAEQVVGRSVDGFTAGFPLDAALDGRDAIVAVGMNGETLPRRHGFPARLLVPGLFGYVSATKWLAEIELATWEGVVGYWVPRGWDREAPVKTGSRIDVPREGGGTLAAGEVVVAGVAWTARSGIARVEVEVDGEWREARVSQPLSSDAWVQWHTRVRLTPGEHRLRVRATTGEGALQAAGPRPPRPNGAEGWHEVAVVVA